MREIRTSGLMSGEGRRGWPKGPLPRPSSTLPSAVIPASGAGGGSVAAWLCEPVGPTGRVVDGVNNIFLSVSYLTLFD